MNTSIGIKETSFGPLLTPARDVRKKSKVLKTFQLTIKNRLGAALKFANGCDNNLALGAEAIKITEGVDSEYISCPLCCRQKLPSAQFANMIPSDQDESACAHYMFCCRPSTSHQLHWHTQHCYLCRGLLVEEVVDDVILDANEKYRQLERHRIRRSLNDEEMYELMEIGQVWKSYTSSHSQTQTHHHHKHSHKHHGSSSKSNIKTHSQRCDVNEAICSLNLAHFYFLGFASDIENSQSQSEQSLSQQSQSLFENSQHQSEPSDQSSQHDMEMVIKYTRRAARYGLPSALFNLSMLYLWGHINEGGVTGGGGVKYLRKAAQLGYIPAHYHLALMIRDNVSIAVKNDQECNSQDIQDMHTFDDMYKYKQNNINNNILLSKTSTSSSDSSQSSRSTLIKHDTTTAQLMQLGIQSKKPSKSERNRTRSLYLLLILVLQGFRDSCLDAGLLLSKNVSCPLNKEMKALGLKKNVNCWHRGFVVWCKGAKLGCPKCTFQIANCYKRGLGVARSSSLAFQCYSKAAAMGYEEAKKELDVLTLDNCHLNQDEHYYANKWKAIESAIHMKQKREDRSESYQSIGGVGVVRDGLVGVTGDIHHHHYHHQREWQPWFKEQSEKLSTEKQSQSAEKQNSLQSKNISDIWGVREVGNQKCDVHELLLSRSKHLNSTQRTNVSNKPQRPDFYKHKHGEVLAEIMRDIEEDVAVEQGKDEENRDASLGTKIIPPNSKYQQNFQKMFGCYDDLPTEAEIVPFKT